MMIQLTDVFVYSLGIMGSLISDYNKRLILLPVIQLRGGHCTLLFYIPNYCNAETGFKLVLLKMRRVNFFLRL